MNSFGTKLAYPKQMYFKPSYLPHNGSARLLVSLLAKELGLSLNKKYEIILASFLAVSKRVNGKAFDWCTDHDNKSRNFWSLFPHICNKSVEEVYKLLKDHNYVSITADFPNQIIGVKDSSYNLYESLKLENFSIFPGSELKLLKGLQLGCSGIITATCNVTSKMSRKVYEDFLSGKKQTQNQKLCVVRSVFDKYNLISGLHTYLSQENKIYKNILPPLSLLNKEDEKNLISSLKDLNFTNKSSMAA